MMLRRRSLRRIGSQIALLALWLQLVLSFGHLHPDDIFRYGRFVAEGSGAAQMVAPHGTGPLVPIPLERNPAADIDCPICASMAMVAAALPSEPPQLRPPPRWDRAAEAANSRFVLTARRFLTFRTRAPPLA